MAYNDQIRVSSSWTSWTRRKFGSVGEWQQTRQVPPVEMLCIRDSRMEHVSVLLSSGAESFNINVGRQRVLVKPVRIRVWEHRNEVGVGHHGVKEDICGNTTRMLGSVQAGNRTADGVTDEDQGDPVQGSVQIGFAELDQKLMQVSGDSAGIMSIGPGGIAISRIKVGVTLAVSIIRQKMRERPAGAGRNEAFHGRGPRGSRQQQAVQEHDESSGERPVFGGCGVSGVVQGRARLRGKAQRTRLHHRRRVRVAGVQAAGGLP